MFYFSILRRFIMAIELSAEQDEVQLPLCYS